MTVAAVCGLAAKDHADQPDAAAFGRGDEIEPGSADIAGFDAVGAIVVLQQGVMVAVLFTVVSKRRFGEVAIVAGKAFD